MCETRTPVSITATMGEPGTTPQRGAVCGAEWAGTAVPTTNAATATPRHMQGAFDACADIPAIRSPRWPPTEYNCWPEGVWRCRQHSTRPGLSTATAPCTPY